MVTGGTQPPTKALRYLYEIVFSVYIPGVILWANASGYKWVGAMGDRGPWVMRVESFIAPGVRHHAPIDDGTLRLSFALLWAFLALTLFVLFVALRRSSLANRGLITANGIVAVIGFPLACLYVFPELYSYGPISLTIVEIAAAAACVLSYLFRLWPKRLFVGGGLLLLHFAFWLWCAWAMRSVEIGGIPLLWYGYDTFGVTRAAPQLLYPTMAILASIIWILYLRNQHGNAVPRPPANQQS